MGAVEQRAILDSGETRALPTAEDDARRRPALAQIVGMRDTRFGSRVPMTGESVGQPGFDTTEGNGQVASWITDDRWAGTAVVGRVSIDVLMFVDFQV